MTETEQTSTEADSDETGRPHLHIKGEERKPAKLTYTAPAEDGSVEQTIEDTDDDPYAGTGRNQPCPCGSGKKYKMCHGRRS